MKSIVSILVLLFLSKLGFGQQEAPSYSISNDSVIYEFSPEQLDSLYSVPYDLVHDFDSIQLSEFIALGTKETLLDKGWKIKRSANGRLQIKKHLDDFMADFTFLDKYRILPDYWKLPRSVLDSSLYERDPLFDKDEEGNTTFYIEGHEDAEKVILAGSFNGWNEQELKMNKIENGWELTLQLQPGIYEYKFIVDEVWTHDLNNSLNLENEHKTLNSILLIGEDVTFRLPNESQAKEVYLSGSFNNWDEKSLPMQKIGDRWQLELKLPPGKHYYKFIVDEQWTIDQENDLREKDEWGRENSVLIVN
ncbi:glycogen-binding domain-containing protein [Portibacter marinus]|uniref:glycogen-binding domain-containing protein n=1 Tax=Portibacter marinus TaxID=2898660 RepID=UPI001F48593F|nr:glycogen-binding domain-containing protein [Portibacter marinus]